MAFFMEVGNWSTTSTYFNHAWVQWGYRGLVQGFRRVNLGSQGEFWSFPNDKKQSGINH